MIDPENPIVIHQAGELIWGSVSLMFEPTSTDVPVLLSHDGELASNDWFARYQNVERSWNLLKPEIDSSLPGGIDNSKFETIDLRADPDVCAAILHFSTSEDMYDWCVRLNGVGEIELIAPND